MLDFCKSYSFGKRTWSINAKQLDSWDRTEAGRRWCRGVVWAGWAELALVQHQLKLLLWHCKEAAQLSCNALTMGSKNGSKGASTVQSKHLGWVGALLWTAVRNTSEGGVGVPGTAWTGSVGGACMGPSSVLTLLNPTDQTPKHHL